MCSVLIIGYAKQGCDVQCIHVGRQLFNNTSSDFAKQFAFGTDKTSSWWRSYHCLYIKTIIMPLISLDFYIESYLNACKTVSVVAWEELRGSIWIIVQLHADTAVWQVLGLFFQKLRRLHGIKYFPSSTDLLSKVMTNQIYNYNR